VELSRDSLKDYAAAIDPDKRRSSSNGGHGNDGGDGGSDQSNGSDFGDGGSGGHGTMGGSPDKDRGSGTEDAESLRGKMLRAEGQNPLVSLMNRLPGKTGQRWVVLPFSFEDQGRDFAVTLRILLTPQASAAGFQAERMALEITGEKQRRNPYPSRRNPYPWRWLFIADNPPGGRLHLTGSFWPARAEKKAAKVLRALEEELAGLLGIEAEQVQIREDEEFPPLSPDSRNEALLSVNEEV
jgi:hypothetical protein